MNKLHQSGLLIYTKPLVFEDEMLLSYDLMTTSPSSTIDPFEGGEDYSEGMI